MGQELVAVKVLVALTRHITAPMSTLLQVVVAVVGDLFQRNTISMEAEEKQRLHIMVLHQVEVGLDVRQIDNIETQTLLITICYSDKLSDINRRPL